MVAVQIRDVPDHVRRVLADRASARGQSLQAFLLSLLEDEARRAANLALLGGFDGRDDGSHLAADEATAALEDARAPRHVPLVERPEVAGGPA